MTELLRNKRLLQSIAELAAANVVKMLHPLSDEISKTEAYRLFGRRWVDHYVHEGAIIGRRNGPGANSKVIFSRSELLALRDAEDLEVKNFAK